MKPYDNLKAIVLYLIAVPVGTCKLPKIETSPLSVSWTFYPSQVPHTNKHTFHQQIRDEIHCLSQSLYLLLCFSVLLSTDLSMPKSKAKTLLSRPTEYTAAVAYILYTCIPSVVSTTEYGKICYCCVKYFS